MKVRIVSYLVLVVFFLFAGNSIAIGEDEIIGPQGSEGPSNVLYGDGAGASMTTGYDNTFIGIDAGNKNKNGYRN